MRVMLLVLMQLGRENAGKRLRYWFRAVNSLSLGREYACWSQGCQAWRDVLLSIGRGSDTLKLSDEVVSPKHQEENLY